MIANLGLVAGAALITYLTRVSGFVISGRAEASSESSALRAFDRFLAWAPVAAFAALIVPDLVSGPGIASARLVGAALAAAAIWRVGRLWVGLAAGFAGFWAVQLLAGGL